MVRYSSGPCSVPGCRREVVALGLCNAHYQRHEAHDGEVFPDVPVGLGHFLAPRSSWNTGTTRAQAGPYICLCEVARVDHLGVCETCGYKTAHRMQRPLQEALIAKRPALAHQQVIEIGRLGDL